MKESDELYRRYKRARTNSSGDVDKSKVENIASADTLGLDEVEKLYQTYRHERTPDFENSIALVMKVAKEKIESERAVRNVLNFTADTRGNSLKETVTTPQKPATVYDAPGEMVSALANWFVDTFSRKWIGAGAFALVLVAVTAGIVGHFSSVSNLENYDLAVVKIENSNRTTPTSNYDLERISKTISDYLDSSTTSSLGFSSLSNDDRRAFHLGVATVDLQFASLAQNQLKSANFGGDHEYEGTINLVSDIATSIKPKELSFQWGRDTQQVFYAAQLALDTENYLPLTHSLDSFGSRIQNIDMSIYSEAEITVTGKITDYFEKTEFSIEDLRIIRDSARDLKTLRR